MKKFSQRIVHAKTDEDRQKVLAWCRSEPDHEDYEFQDGSDVYVIIEDGKIMAMYEVYPMLICHPQFKQGVSGFQTARTAETMFAGLDGAGIRPVISSNFGGPLIPFGKKFLTEVYKNFTFFMR